MTRPLRILCLLAICAAAPCHASDKKILDKIFETWAQTQGGIGADTLVTSYDIQETLSIKSTAAATSLDIHVVRTRLSHFRIEFTPPSGEMVVLGFDGEILWQARPTLGFSLIKPVRDDALIWQNSLFIGLEVVPAGVGHYTKEPEQVDGADCVVAAVNWIGSSYETCYFDPNTLRLVRVVRPPSPGVAGSRKTSFDFGDYRPVGKLSVPFLFSVSDGVSVSTYRRSKITLNQQDPGPPVRDNRRPPGVH
jgi:hypothetical protein